MKSEPARQKNGGQEQIFTFAILREQTAVERQSSPVSVKHQPPAFSHL